MDEIETVHNGYIYTCEPDEMVGKQSFATILHCVTLRFNQPGAHWSSHAGIGKIALFPGSRIEISPLPVKTYETFWTEVGKVSGVSKLTDDGWPGDIFVSFIQFHR